MKTRLLLSLFLLGIASAGLTTVVLGQQAASVTWNCIPPDSQHVTAAVGNVTGGDIAGTDTFIVRSYSGTPNGPLGVTHMRWWPFAGGAALSWGDETEENPGRYVELSVSPTPGNRFIADSVSVYLLGGGTSTMRVNMYSSTDPTFATRTLLNVDSAIALVNSGSATSSDRFAFALNATAEPGQSVYIRLYPYYMGAPSTSKYLYTQLAIITGTTETSNGVGGTGSEPDAWQLAQNYPNPFNPSTVISYQLATPTRVRIAVFDILGNEVRELVNGFEDAGAHQVRFDASGLSTGMYVYRIQAGSFTQSRSMMLVR